MALYYAQNTAMVTTAFPTPVATGTSIKTHLQIAPPSSLGIQVVAMGVEFDVALTAVTKVELIETDVAATVTAHVAAGVQPYDSYALSAGSSAASGVTLGTSATGYTATAEGTITATRNLKAPKVLPIGAQEYEWEWSLGREPVIRGGKFGRIRITTATTVNVLAWLVWQE